jgi:3-deoxy-manno-octulosonate cytidylyltransferase (CMP-KDO synthetase)
VNHTGDNPQNNTQQRTVAIIPARLASTRLPAKALLEIDGKPMVCCVADRAKLARNVDRVIVATDSHEIFDAVSARNIEVVMTSADHASGTDRIAEVAEKLPDAEIIVNVQGDEPMISPETIERAVAAMEAEIERGDVGAGMVTTWEPIESKDELLNFGIVKVVLDDHDFAVYFSRSPIPFPQEGVKRHGGSPDVALENEPELLKLFRKHTGLYVYRREVLLNFTKWPRTQLERTEALEQLRALANGVKIKLIEASSKSVGVDTLADLERVRVEVEKGRLLNVSI